MDTKLCKQCKGFCCDDIGLSISPNELSTAYHAWGQRSDGKSMEYPSMALSEAKVNVWHDIYLTYPMLVFSHQDKVHPDGEIDMSNEDNPKTIYHYSCKHHNKKTKDCDIHEIRPMMCRRFPDNGYCSYRKVTDKKVKAFRPKWFKPGMAYYDWYYGMYPDQKPVDEAKKEVEEKKL